MVLDQIPELLWESAEHRCRILTRLLKRLARPFRLLGWYIRRRDDGVFDGINEEEGEDFAVS